MAVGCVHSIYACPEAQKAILRFRDSWKPHTVVDLGDVHDWTAFRTGAKGTKDETADIDLDFNAGADWLRRYRPTHRSNGNHDNRIYKLCLDHRAMVAKAAAAVVEDVRRIDEKNKTIVKPYFPIRENWHTFGDTKFGHGLMYNENAVRDHAEHFGKCVIAHLHSPGSAQGRREDKPTGWCVGTTADPDKLEYAVVRRAWEKWAHGLAQFEYNDRECHVWLTKQTCNHGGPEEWRFLL